MTGPTLKLLSTLLASSSSPLNSSSSSDSFNQPANNNNNNKGTITGLYRHAVKGLSADALESVTIRHAHDTFPDDRRFALLYDKHVDKFNPDEPEWLHKEKFLCAFTQPQLLSQYEASYQLCQSPPSSGTIESYGSPCDDASCSSNQGDQNTQRLLTLRDRSKKNNNQQVAENNIVWGPQDLETPQGRQSLGDFFTQQSGLPVQCVTADSSTAKRQKSSSQQQTHQFGNTSSGWKQRMDTRTIHIINANTVRQVAEQCQIPSLNPTRFRPNIIVEGWEPWSEFDWIGKSLQIINKQQQQHIMKLSILSRTVRCDGVSVDPLDPETVLDIPGLLTKQFPEHGPFLGVYATIETPGLLSIGDEISPILLT